MATPTKWGSEFLVNTTTADWQGGPAIAALADGRFLAVWQDDSNSNLPNGGDTSSSAVRAQIFNADGTKSGAEFIAPTTIADTQSQPTASQLSNGRFVVAWADWSQSNQPDGGDTSGLAIRGQIFNADGSRFGSEFLANTTTTDAQDTPVVTALAAGRFVVTWVDQSASNLPDGGDTSARAVRGQVFNADGTKSGAEFVAETTTADDQVAPAITTLGDGGFVIAWADYSLSNLPAGGDTDTSAIRAQIFSSTGEKSGAEFVVNTTTAAGQTIPAIAALGPSGFVVTWIDYSLSNLPAGGDTEISAIRGQVFSAGGVKSGSEFLVNTTTSGDQTNSAIATLHDGRFVVVWKDGSQSGDDTSGYAIRGQVFDADGTKSGAEFVANTTTDSDQDSPTITVLADGRFAVVWPDSSGSNLPDGGDTDSQALRGQIFDPREAAVDLTGTALGDQFIGTGFDDQMHGLGANDRFLGADGKDALFGDGGKDRLFGDGGKDTIDGGAGKDTLTGGDGNDKFVFTAKAHSAVGGNRDTIADFTTAGKGEKINLSAVFDGTLHFRGTGEFTAAVGEVRFEKHGGKTIVQIDLDHDAKAEMEIALNGSMTLHGSDFVL